MKIELFTSLHICELAMAGGAAAWCAENEGAASAFKISCQVSTMTTESNESRSNCTRQISTPSELHLFLRATQMLLTSLALVKSVTKKGNSYATTLVH